MLIPVIYPDGRHDLVKDFYLSILIDAKRILKFKRADGWVNLSSRQIRGRGNRRIYAGPERRFQDSFSGDMPEDRTTHSIM